MTPWNKVFGIGLSKTGTTSLAAALNLLGIPTVHFPPVPRLHELLQQHRGATDTSIAEAFELLDRAYPASKFILTYRDLESWQASARSHFTRKSESQPWVLELRRRLYGSPEWDEALYTERFVQHNGRVAAYFASRPQDLLKLDVIGGQGWETLCPFLGVPIPDVPFPHRNRTADKLADPAASDGKG